MWGGNNKLVCDVFGILEGKSIGISEEEKKRIFEEEVNKGIVDAFQELTSSNPGAKEMDILNPEGWLHDAFLKDVLRIYRRRMANYGLNINVTGDEVEPHVTTFRNKLEATRPKVSREQIKEVMRKIVVGVSPSPEGTLPDFIKGVNAVFPALIKDDPKGEKIVNTVGKPEQLKILEEVATDHFKSFKGNQPSVIPKTLTQPPSRVPSEVITPGAMSESDRRRKEMMDRAARMKEIMKTWGNL
jgi:hypothetical protein